jgi:hypothetical protein
MLDQGLDENYFLTHPWGGGGGVRVKFSKKMKVDEMI